MSEKDFELDVFSERQICSQEARLNLEKKYSKLLQLTDKFNRQYVSYQANKTETLHDWLKFKEGFSAILVKILIDDFNLKPGDLILDPFMGSGTTSLVAQQHGINSIGFDILPVSKLAFNVKINAAKFNTEILTDILHKITQLNFPKDMAGLFSDVPITWGAFPDSTESEIIYLTEWINNSNYEEDVKNLIHFLILASLEDVSYTRKDGQYLRWDYRSKKIIQANKDRQINGKPPFKTKLDKGDLPSLKKEIQLLLTKIIRDIKEMKKKELPDSEHKLMVGSVLSELPKLNSSTVNCVITSPPYCNRYDYTRTYALELVYLGMDQKQIRELRQNLLTCTVENRPKLKQIEDFYINIDRLDEYKKVIGIIKQNAALQEILSALRIRNERGDVNNKGVIRMVEGYFTELAFVYYELFRVCKKGACVVFVNDNVRYAGEVIPVDFISTELAESFGFTPMTVYVLPQTKGNSSQQMKKFGQVRLRKSITVWKKA